MVDHDVKWMKLAIEEAKKAAKDGEIPVGAVLVRQGEVLARAHNLCEVVALPTAHAELLAIEAACRKVGHWRLEECTLYVTLEPCPMCAGAIVNSRIARVVYGAKDANGGAFDSVMNLRSYPLCSKPRVEGGVLEGECAAILSGFFERKRKNRKNF